MVQFRLVASPTTHYIRINDVVPKTTIVLNTRFAALLTNLDGTVRCTHDRVHKVFHCIRGVILSSGIGETTSLYRLAHTLFPAPICIPVDNSSSLAVRACTGRLEAKGIFHAEHALILGRTIVTCTALTEHVLGAGKTARTAKVTLIPVIYRRIITNRLWTD